MCKCGASFLADKHMTNKPRSSALNHPPTLLALSHAWHYLRTQWRRGVGLNVSQIDDLLFVGGQFRARQWPALRALGIRAVLSLQAEREDTFHGSPPDRVVQGGLQGYLTDPIFLLEPLLIGLVALHWTSQRLLSTWTRMTVFTVIIGGFVAFSALFLTFVAS